MPVFFCSCWLVHPSVYIPPTHEVSEVGLNQGVFNRAAGMIGLEIAVGHVGLVCSAVGQDVIPGPVPGRSRLRDGLIPFVGPAEHGINPNDDTAVVEQCMFDDVAH